MQRVLVVAVVGLLVASVSALAVIDPEAGPIRSSEAPEATTTSTLPPLTEGRARVTGTVATLTATGSQGDALTPPFTLTMADPGGGVVRIPAVTVDGQEQTIEWSGGRPLPVTGRGGLDVDGTTMVADPEGLKWSLDGGPRGLDPGAYTLGSAVAVGSSARDQVTFRAAAGDGLESRGDVRATVPPRMVRIESPDGSLELAGSLTVETVNVTRPLPSLRFGPGIYVVVLTPAPGGYTIEATLEGRFGGG